MLALLRAARGLPVLGVFACAPHADDPGAESIYDLKIIQPDGLELDTERETVTYPGCFGPHAIEMVLSDGERRELWQLVAESTPFQSGDQTAAQGPISDCTGWRLELRPGAFSKAVEPTHCSWEEHLDLTIISSQMRTMFAEHPQWRDRVRDRCRSRALECLGRSTHCREGDGRPTRTYLELVFEDPIALEYGVRNVFSLN